MTEGIIEDGPDCRADGCHDPPLPGSLFCGRHQLPELEIGATGPLAANRHGSMGHGARYPQG